jgi:hypothetical protein
MSDVVVIALAAEGIPAALRTAVRTDCSTAVRALRHGNLPAWHPNVVISEFNLTELIHGKITEYQRSTMQSSQPKSW